MRALARSPSATSMAVPPLARRYPMPWLSSALVSLPVCAGSRPAESVWKVGFVARLTSRKARTAIPAIDAPSSSLPRVLMDCRRLMG